MNTTNEKQSVATETAAVRAMHDTLALVRDLMGGTKAMREAGQRRLPKWPNEDAEAHSARLASSTLFPAYSRTVQTLVGKPFSKPITYGENVPARLQDWMKDDADLQGRDLGAFAATVMESALAYGICGILVDVPPAKLPKLADGTTRPLTQAEEKEQNIRPYLVHIHPWNVLGWRSGRVGGVTKLTLLRLREYVTEDDGEWGEKEVEQVRVLRPGSWEVHRKNGVGEWVLHESGRTSLKEIPYVPVYGQRVDFMVGRPPMLEMAHLNVKHWQSQSDQDNILHVARVPILVVSGVNDDDQFKLTVGASAAVKLPNNAQANFVEHSGAAIGAGRTSLEDLKEEMRQAGAELLVLQAGKITATQVSTENAVGMCALQRITADVEDALDMVLQICAEWVGEANGGNVTLFKDFGAATLAEASATLLLSMQQAGLLTKETMLNETKRRGILSPDLDVEAELDGIAGEGPPLGSMGEEGGQQAGQQGQTGGQPAGVDLKPVLDAIAALPKPEDAKPVMPPEVKAALDSISQQFDALTKQVAQQSANAGQFDSTALEKSIAALAGEVGAIGKKVSELEGKGQSDAAKMVAEAIAPVVKTVSEFAANKEAKTPDMEAMRSMVHDEVRAAVLSITPPQPAPIVMLDQSGAMTKQIQFKRDQSGQITGASVVQH